MSPDIIAVDEVAENSEIEAIRLGVNSGVKFIVTVIRIALPPCTRHSSVYGSLQKVFSKETTASGIIRASL